jgi:hypothetical protein
MGSVKERLGASHVVEAGAVSQSVVPLRAYVQDLPSFRAFVMLWGGFALAIVVRDAPAALAVAAFAAAAALLSIGIRVSGALAVGGVAWLVANGFVVHDYGTLAWTGAADAVRLGVLLAAAVCVAEATGQTR